MANLVTAQQAAGTQLTDVVETTIFVASSRQEDLGAAWNVVRAAFGDHDAPGTVTHWSTRLLAGHLGVSSYLKFATDPELEAKIRDVVGLYLDPPAKAVVVIRKSRPGGHARTPPPAEVGVGARVLDDDRRSERTAPQSSNGGSHTVALISILSAATTLKSPTTSTGRCWPSLSSRLVA